MARKLISCLPILLITVTLSNYASVSAKLIGLGGFNNKLFYYDKTITDGIGSFKICQDAGLEQAVIGSYHELDFLNQQHSNHGFSGAFWIQDPIPSTSGVVDISKKSLISILSYIGIWEPPTCSFLIVDSSEETNKLRSTSCHLHKMYTLCQTANES